MKKILLIVAVIGLLLGSSYGAEKLKTRSIVKKDNIGRIVEERIYSGNGDVIRVIKYSHETEKSEKICFNRDGRIE